MYIYKEGRELYEQDWPVYILLTGVFVFFVYVVVHSKLQEKKDKEQKK